MKILLLENSFNRNITEEFIYNICIILHDYQINDCYFTVNGKNLEEVHEGEGPPFQLELNFSSEEEYTHFLLSGVQIKSFIESLKGEAIKNYLNSIEIKKFAK